MVQQDFVIGNLVEVPDGGGRIVSIDITHIYDTTRGPVPQLGADAVMATCWKRAGTKQVSTSLTPQV